MSESNEGVFSDEYERTWAYLMQNPNATYREVSLNCDVSLAYAKQQIARTSKPWDRKLREDILDNAKQHICVDRNATHGEAEDSFSSIAGHWTWWLSEKLAPDQVVTAYDVAQMMVGFKQARMRGNPEHRDSAEDLCGYGALAGEIGSKDDNQEEQD